MFVNFSQEKSVVRQIARKQRRVVWEQLIWALLAIGLVEVVGYLWIPADRQAEWLSLALLTGSGAFLSFPVALILGGVVFSIACFWFLFLIWSHSVSGNDLLVLVLIPFAPLWFSILKVRISELARLEALMELPQVRYAIEISPKTLLPNSRAIDRRIHSFLLENPTVPFALLFRLRIPDIRQQNDMLGVSNMTTAIFKMADDLRIRFRVGDLIAEDLEKQGALYALIFPNQDNLGLSEIKQKVQQAVVTSGISPISIEYAFIPEDGKLLYHMNWHDISLLEGER